MNKYELVERLDWAQASLHDAVTHILKVLNEGGEMLDGNDIDDLQRALEDASEARHVIATHGPFPRLQKEIGYGEED